MDQSKDSRGATAVLTIPGEMVRKTTLSLRCVEAYCAVTAACAALEMTYGPTNSNPVWRMNSISPRPEPRVMTLGRDAGFLLEEARMSGRKALVAWIVPTTLMLNYSASNLVSVDIDLRYAYRFKNILVKL